MVTLQFGAPGGPGGKDGAEGGGGDNKALYGVPVSALGAVAVDPIDRLLMRRFL